MKRVLDAQTTIATYAYDRLNRRISKVVTNRGDEVVANDGGNATVHFYYCGYSAASSLRRSIASSLLPWSICETRNGGNKATRQWVWGPRYIDEVVLMDVNGAGDTTNDCDEDTSGAGDSSGAFGDQRYFYHQDRNWNVVALTAYGGGDNGKIVAWYAYAPYGTLRALEGDTAGSNSGRVHLFSAVGDPFSLQGLSTDTESNKNHARRREYKGDLQRFVQLDPLYSWRYPGPAIVDGANLYGFARSRPVLGVDPFGACTIGAVRSVGPTYELCGLCGVRACTDCQRCKLMMPFSPPACPIGWVTENRPCTSCMWSAPAAGPPCTATAWPPSVACTQCQKLCAHPSWLNCQSCCECMVGAFPPGTPPGPYLEACMAACAIYPTQ